MFQKISRLIWQNVVRVVGPLASASGPWPIVISSLSEALALVLLAASALLVDYCFKWFELTGAFLLAMKCLHVIGQTHMVINMINVMMNDSKGLLGTLAKICVGAVKQTVLRWSFFSNGALRVWTTCGGFAAVASVVAAGVFLANTNSKNQPDVAPAPGPPIVHDQPQWPEPVSYPGTGDLSVLVTPVPGDSGRERDRLIQSVDDQIDRQKGRRMVGFRYSENELSLDESTREVIQEEAKREKADFVLATYRTGGVLHLELLPTVKTTFIAGSVYFPPIPEEARDLSPLAKQIAPVLRVALAGLSFDRGLRQEAVAEIRDLLRGSWAFPPGIDTEEMHLKVADFLAAGRVPVSVSRDSAAEALAEYAASIDGFKSAGKLFDYRAALNKQALLLLAVGKVNEAFEVIERSLVDFPFEVDPTQWIQSVVNRSLVVPQLQGQRRQSAIAISIRQLQYAMQHRPQGLPIDMRAKLNNALAVLYVATDKGDGYFAALAVPLYEQSRVIFTALCEKDSAFCSSLAATRNNLANALFAVKSGDRKELLGRASQLLVQSLEVRTKEADQSAWGASMINLARVEVALGEVTGEQTFIDEAISRADTVLKEDFIQGDPHRWAGATEILAKAHGTWQGAARASHDRLAQRFFETAAQLYEASGDQDGAHRCREEVVKLDKVLSHRAHRSAEVALGTTKRGVFPGRH
jgi:tetratricopeptide (TPR) repeat protein